MRFGDALEKSKIGFSIRMPNWSDEVLVQAHFPDDRNQLTAPYLYIEYGTIKSPWQPTMVELFSDEWEIVYLK